MFKQRNTALIALAVSTFITNASYAETLESRVESLEKTLNKLSKVKVFGYLQYDKTMIASNNDDDLNNNSKLRRGTIGAKGKAKGDWKYLYEVDFAGDNANITDAFIKKKLSNNSEVKIGQYKEPFSLSELTSPKDLTFIEIASINGFAAGRSAGIGYNKYLDHVNIYTGVFGDSFGDSSTSDDEDFTITARTTFANELDNGFTYHIGAAVRSSQPSGNSKTYSFKPEASIETTNMSAAVTTGAIANIDRTDQVGLEFIAKKDRFSMQAEYIQTDLDRASGSDDYTLDGGYIQLSYFLTDNTRNYKKKSATLGRVDSHGEKDAFEFSYRYSTVDANDNGLNAGSMDNSSFALNWYVSPQIKFVANYIMVEVDDNANYAGDVDIFALRAQVNF